MYIINSRVPFRALFVYKGAVLFFGTQHMAPILESYPCTVQAFGPLGALPEASKDSYFKAFGPKDPNI